jgi:hypothetical protein
MSEYGKLKPKWKKLWLAALRSGKYGQTRGNLASPRLKKMCCLGVLCDIVDPEGWGDVVIHKGSEGSRKRVRLYDGKTGIPSMAIWKKAMAPEKDGRVFILAQGSLASMNDEDKFSFAEIADWIEVNL